ncbi:hypothetical protein BV22DRAFT_1025220 [Leucogyrophana mollusca]|uniref:Uncharacterized protein n=1 Tax=Leucogyrophana mollusca TaxID=85980 RepID=A0ACB8AYY2_9AGAM|nr:hypothetical protein BV22DRAFT_1025220 [Leucogyrophana mollusca]
MSRLPYYRSFVLVSCLSVARAFSMAAGPATQCDDFSVSWTGGQPPFEIMLVPQNTIYINVPVPSSAFANNQGSYSINELPLAEDQEFVVVMSDATGFGSGGVSNTITVGGPVGNNGCNTTSQSPSFYFDTPETTFQQCSQYAFDNYVGATLPVNVTASISGLIPGGDLFVVQFPTSSNYSYAWTVDVAAGTSLILFMTDATGAQGGTTNISTVVSSEDSSCLFGSYPSSTGSAAPQMTSTPISPRKSGASLSVGVIAGIAIGGTAVLVTATALLLYYRRRRHGNSPLSHIRFTKARDNSLDLDQDPNNLTRATSIHAFPYEVGSLSQRAPFMSQYMALGQRAHDPSSQDLSSPARLQDPRDNSATDSSLGFSYAESSVASREDRRPSAEAEPLPRQTARFVVHTDIEDASPNGEELVELPPQYSEGRQPIPSLPQATDGHASKR